MRKLLLIWSTILVTAGCREAAQGPANTVLTPDTHLYFPIVAGPHAVDCNTCHGGTSSFKDFSCLNCHGHEDQSLTDNLHNSIPGYQYQSASCYTCHATGARQAFLHVGVSNNCASCHFTATGADFPAPLPAGFVHSPPLTPTLACEGCHSRPTQSNPTATWKDATGGAPSDKSDPQTAVSITAGIPTYSGTSIATITNQTELLSMPMDHSTSSIDPGVLSNCANCHTNASGGDYYPGNLHGSLANVGAMEPTQCLDCHASSAPTGFVGPLATNPVRTPTSAEMKHDAVGWVGGAPGAAPLVTADCALCHVSPSALHIVATWAMALDRSSPAQYHPALAGGGQPQPGSCLDCHANSRPDRLLVNGACPAGSNCQQAAGLPAGVVFDHTVSDALNDCVVCHVASGPAFATWNSGAYHLPGSATPASCLPCHDGERPTSSASWINPSYQNSPFDYGTNSWGVTHGAGQDCAVCHDGPGTGSWGAGQNWAMGSFQHGPATLSATNCLSCHASQRPDLVLSAAAATAALNFDHSLNGTGDCFGCHQATVRANHYKSYDNPGTQTLPGGDWQGGLAYPGDTLVGSPTQFITLTTLALQRAATNNPNKLVTGTTSATTTLYNEMLHTSASIPAQIQPAAPDGGSNLASCWHCHAHDSTGAVTALKDGEFHKSLNDYALSPDGGAIVGLPQPTFGCNDCHAQMRPMGVVESNSSDLIAMDHNALFTNPVTFHGVSANGAADMDCSDCHKSPATIPGVSWSGGVFHASIGSAVPKDCTVCHYPLMADSSAADVVSGTSFAMAHKSAQLTFQECASCHTAALGKATTTPSVATLFQVGSFHASANPQPTKCNDCHTGSEPAAGASTQSSNKYTLSKGGTTTNQGQWMNHGAASVVGLDCAVCHAKDATASGSAWATSDTFHGVAGVVAPTTCQGCHGLKNGLSTVAGTKNNLTSGLTDSTTATSASADATTGVATGTLDQIDHADVNVSGQDCNFCHTQVGISKVAGVAGKEWAQATFHKNFSAANPLVLDGVTGRCSNCHMNVVPGSTFTLQDHSSFTASSAQDCSSCHAWPGTGTAAAPNWKGATGAAPTCLTTGGFTISDPPAANNSTTQTGLASSGASCLAHPTVPAGTACTTCHSSSSGGKNAIGYDHASALLSAKAVNGVPPANVCAACHEVGSDLVGTSWNNLTTVDGGAGDTRPYTLASVQASGKTEKTANHFYPTDCYECHSFPSGTATTSSGAALEKAWSFHHTTSRMTKSTAACTAKTATCYYCHSKGCNN